MAPTRIFTVDVETSGSVYTKNGILSIGWCFGYADTTFFVSSGQINMTLPEGHGFEEKCWDEFWSKNLPVLEKLKVNAVSPLEGITQFAEILDRYDSEYEVAIASDNPSFDIGFLNYYLAVYLGRRPLTYKSNGQYRPVFDTDCYTRGVLHMQYDRMWTSDSDIIKKLNINTNEFSEHTHTPESDATRIYQLHSAVLAALRPKPNQRPDCPCDENGLGC